MLASCFTESSSASAPVTSPEGTEMLQPRFLSTSSGGPPSLVHFLGPSRPKATWVEPGKAGQSFQTCVLKGPFQSKLRTGGEGAGCGMAQNPHEPEIRN